MGIDFIFMSFVLWIIIIRLMLEGVEDVAAVMEYVTISYVYYFNKKYKKVGCLFQDRFKSEMVEQEGHYWLWKGICIKIGEDRGS